MCIGIKCFSLPLNTDWKSNQSSATEDAESESLLTKEKKLVDRFLVKSGMLRFSFLLECCHPGSIPDPTLVSAMLELVSISSPVIMFDQNNTL